MVPTGGADALAQPVDLDGVAHPLRHEQRRLEEHLAIAHRTGPCRLLQSLINAERKIVRPFEQRRNPTRHIEKRVGRIRLLGGIGNRNRQPGPGIDGIRPRRRIDVRVDRAKVHRHGDAVAAGKVDADLDRHRAEKMAVQVHLGQGRQKFLVRHARSRMLQIRLGTILPAGGKSQQVRHFCRTSRGQAPVATLLDRSFRQPVPLSAGPLCIGN